MSRAWGPQNAQGFHLEAVAAQHSETISQIRTAALAIIPVHSSK
jgi:hypothetical protein